MALQNGTGETLFLHYLAEMLADLPESGGLAARVHFGTERAARLLKTLGEELEAAGEGDQADAYRMAAAQLENLPMANGAKTAD